MKSPHKPRVVLGVLAVTAIGALTLGSGLSARADQVACDTTIYAADSSNGLRTLFTVDPADVPPPLRQFHWDCASHLADPTRTNTRGETSFDLIFINIGFPTVLAILKSFDEAAWAPDHHITTEVDNSPDETWHKASLTLEELGTLSPPPQYFASNFASGAVSTNLTYVDGVNYWRGDGTNTPQQSGGAQQPSLVVRVYTAASSTGITDPSVLSSLKTIQDAIPTPTQTVVIGTSAVMLMLIVGWPGTLLTGVIRKRYEPVAARLNSGIAGRMRATMKKAQPSWLIWIGFAVAALLAGFIDPRFGFNFLSLRLLLSGFATYLVFNLLGWTVVAKVVRRVQPGANPVINFRWGSLLIVIVAVFGARLLGFAPGVIFGLVAGLVFAVTLAASREALVILVGSGFTLGVGLLAWTLYSILALFGGGNGFLVVLSEFFSALTVEGIATLPLALLPLAVLDGGALFTWNKWVWGGAYTVALAAFMLVLITVPASFGQIPGDFIRWILIFVIFGVVAVGVWFLDRELARRKAKPKSVASGDDAPILSS